MLSVHAVLVAFAALSMAVAPTTTAPVPVLQFEGTVTAVDSGVGVGSPMSVRLDCTTLPCSLSATVFAEDVTIDVTGGALPFEGTAGSWEIAAAGDPCNLSYIGGGTFSAVLEGSTLQMTRSGNQSGEFDCPDGSTIQYEPFVFQASATLVSGDLCAIDGSCGPTATPTPTAIPVEADGGTGASPDVIPGAPSTLSTLPTAADAFTPLNLLWAAGGAVVLIILVALPSQLMNSAVEKLGEGRRALNLTGWPIAAGGVLVAAIASTFIEPDTVFDLRVFASVLIAFLLDAVIGWLVVIQFVRRTDRDAKPTFRLLPAMLALVIVAVLFSRLTGFQPGLMFGLVAGVVFAGLVGAAQRARVVLVELGWAFGLGVVAWVLYSVIPADIVFVRETLAAIAIGGIAALPIALLPVPGLAGRTIWEWNRRVWIAGYAVGLLGFFLVLMPRPFSWDTVGISVWAWGAVFAAYAIGAVVLWAVVTKPWNRTAAAE